MGKIVIHQTDEKQTVILTNDAEGIQGVYFGEDGVEKPVGINIDAIATGAEPSGNIVINAEEVVRYAFNYDLSVTGVDAVGVKNINESCFAHCEKVTYFNFPELETMTGSYQFDGCFEIEYMVLPKMASILPGRSLQGCHKLKAIDLGLSPEIGNQALNDTPMLRTIVLRKEDAITKLHSWSSITMGGIYANPASSEIYVPQSLLSSYESHTEWAKAKTAGVTFKAIEGSVYENAYADGTPIE